MPGRFFAVIRYALNAPSGVERPKKHHAERDVDGSNVDITLRVMVFFAL